MKKKIERQASQLAALLRRLGVSEEEIAQRIHGALDRRSQAKKKAGQLSSVRFEGCASVTATSKRLGMRRATLFERLSAEGWMYRTTTGWRGTDSALSIGWVVERGSRSIRWPQLSRAGVLEIARRMEIADQAAQ